MISIVVLLCVITLILSTIVYTSHNTGFVGATLQRYIPGVGEGSGSIDKCTTKFVPGNIQECGEELKKAFEDPKINPLKLSEDAFNWLSENGFPTNPKNLVAMVTEKQNIIQSIDRIVDGCNGINQKKDIDFGKISTCVLIINEEIRNSEIGNITSKLDIPVISPKIDFCDSGIVVTKVQEKGCQSLADTKQKLLDWYESFYAELRCGMKPVNFTQVYDVLQETKGDLDNSMENIVCQLPHDDAEKLTLKFTSQLYDRVTGEDNS